MTTPLLRLGTPWTTGGGIVPAGPWQQWRRRAYAASHVAPDED